MKEHFSFSLVNPQTKNLAFKIFSLQEDNNDFDHIQRLGYFSLILVENGNGKLKVDFNEYQIQSNSLLSFAPYQPFMIDTQQLISGSCILFHPEFFCIYKHMQDVACNGVLFNNIYGLPYTELKTEQVNRLKSILDQMKAELPLDNFAQCDMLISLLRIFMIYSSRIKIEINPNVKEVLSDNKEPFILQDLKDAIENNFKTKHSAKDYADLLNISASGLAKICKKYYNKTLTNLISERIIVEAKRELYLTSKPIKQIAYELGYLDEYYFSRFFKKNAEVSPQIYRETVGFTVSN